jgi:hypothetical protein
LTPLTLYLPAIIEEAVLGLHIISRNGIGLVVESPTAVGRLFTPRIPGPSFATCEGSMS